LEDGTIYHPNIQEVRSTKAIIDYILKHSNYISKYKIDNLQIVQIIIEKEIKKEQYYKSPGKHSLNFIMEIKHIENHSMLKILIKVAHWHDKFWFDGYDKQAILILDDFDSTQLSFSTF
ncbi:12727_t:CDS:2, partial [Gigaspora rosea]